MEQDKQIMTMDNIISPESVDSLLRQSRESELLRFTTIGSVDDGKSTLIGKMLHDSKSIYKDHLEELRHDSEKLGREKLDLALLTDGLRAFLSAGDLSAWMVRLATVSTITEKSRTEISGLK